MGGSLSRHPLVSRVPHRSSRLVVEVLTLFGLLCLSNPVQAQAQSIPPTQTAALDGHAVTLPRDLPGAATVLILGFGRHSQDATTAWEKPVRQQLAQPGNIGFYDVAMIGEIPGFVRPMVLRAIKRQVPDVLKPNFLPLTADEDAWKATASYSKDQPDAAYVLLVDKSGHVQWSTHSPYSPDGFAELTRRAHSLAAASH